MDKVRFGIIGVGNMGTGHSKKFLAGEVENAVLTAVCDVKQAKLDAFRQLEGADTVKTFTDHRDMFASGLIDAVIVATPHYDHPPLVIEALNSGFHVICEKPAGVYTKQVKEMNAVAEKSDKLFTMMFNQRTNCVYRKIREMVTNGELGEIRRINWIVTDWYRSQSYYDSGDWRATWKGEGGGVLLNQCPHQLDLLQWVTDMMPAKIHSFCHFGKWHDIEVEDDVTAYLEYANGATGVFITTTGDAPGTNRLEITGNNGKLVCTKKSLEFTKLEMPEREFNATWTGGFGSPKKETFTVETDGKNPQHLGILQNFTNAILGTEPLFVDGKEGLKGVQIMDAMLLSTFLGRAVELPFDDDLYLEELKKRQATGREKSGCDRILDTAGTYGSKEKR